MKKKQPPLVLRLLQFKDARNGTIYLVTNFLNKRLLPDSQAGQIFRQRWGIEEYHKALKTGGSVQRRLLREAPRLEAMVGLMSVVSVRLLQLKSVARSAPDSLARDVVPLLWLLMLKAVRKKLRRVHDLTVYEFYREVAKLGGFLGRRSDGEPGWITIWRGWEKLNTLVQGAELAIELKKCG